MPLHDPCGCCESTLDSSWIDHHLIHGHGGMSFIDEAVRSAPFCKKMYSNSTVNDRNLCGIWELYDLDFCGLRIFIAGAALDTEWRGFHAEKFHLWLHREAIAVIGEEVGGLGWGL